VCMSIAASVHGMYSVRNAAAVVYRCRSDQLQRGLSEVNGPGREGLIR
jgi:hypothetical protein